MATTTHHTHRLHEGSVAAQGLGGLWSGLSAWIAQYRSYRRTLNELSALSDRDLTDMGLHRSNIPDVAREAAYRT
jgi:uncharacterized protein YjiS (DUF1127 family)